MSSAKDSKKPQAKVVVSEMADKKHSTPYDPGNYRIISKETVTIYSPNIITKQKRIISV
jgi:hypothetical protein